MCVFVSLAGVARCHVHFLCDRQNLGLPAFFPTHLGPVGFSRTLGGVTRLSRWPLPLPRGRLHGFQLSFQFSQGVYNLLASQDSPRLLHIDDLLFRGGAREIIMNQEISI